MLTIERKRWHQGNVIDSGTFTISDLTLGAYVDTMKKTGYEAFLNPDGIELVFWVSDNFSVTETIMEELEPISTDWKVCPVCGCRHLGYPGDEGYEPLCLSCTWWSADILSTISDPLVVW